MRTALRSLAVTTTCASLAVAGLAVPASAASSLSCPAFANATTSAALPVSGTDTPATQQVFSRATTPPTPVSFTGGMTGADGTFSATINLTQSQVPDGPVTLQATSPATPGGATCTVTKDTSPPAITGLTASRTNASQPETVVGGSTQAGSTVVVAVTDAAGKAVPTRSTTAVGTGSFTTTVDVTGLADGTLTVRATATDPAGNVGPQATTTATRDTSRPTVTDLLSTETNASQRATTVTGVTEPGSSVALSATSPGSSAPVTGTATAPAGTFSATLDLSSLADGTVTVTATATDAALNTGPSATTTSTKDVAAPTISGLAGTAVTTTNGTSTVTGTVSETGADVVLTVSDGSTAVTKSLTDLTTTGFSTTMDLSSLQTRTLTLSAIATDAVGNTGPAAVASIGKTTGGATPTGTPTSTPTINPTSTPTATPTSTPTGTPTATPTGTPTPTGTATPGSSAITGLTATDSGPARSTTVVSGTTGANRTVTVTLFNAGGDTATGSAVASGSGAFSVTTDLRSFRSGTVTVTAVSRDSSGEAGTPASTTLQRDGRPAAPAQPGARAGDASVRILLTSPPFDNGSALTGYRAVSSPGGRVFTAPAGATSILAQGLVNGVAHTFVVTATNGRGESAASAATPAVTPRFATVVSVNGSPSTATSGSPLRLTGSLKRKTSGAALAGFRITVRARFDNGASKVLGTVATNSRGVWALTTTPTQNAVYTATYTGRPQDAPTSASRRILARTKVTLSAPSGRSSSALVMSGSTSPNKRGAVVKVYRVVNGAERLVAQATVSSTGSYRVSKRLARGTYDLVARIGPTSGNTSGVSPRVTSRRT